MATAFKRWAWLAKRRAKQAAERRQIGRVAERRRVERHARDPHSVAGADGELAGIEAVQGRLRGHPRGRR